MSKVYRLIVERMSEEVFCPMTSNTCRGRKCAAWFWVNEPQLTAVQYISLEAAQNSGLLGRNGITGPLPAVLENLEAFNETYKKFSQIEVQASDFLPPAGIGWKVDGEPYYDSDEGHWFLAYARQADPIAAGYCGMVGQQPYNNGE